MGIIDVLACSAASAGFALEELGHCVGVKDVVSFDYSNHIAAFLRLRVGADTRNFNWVDVGHGGAASDEYGKSKEGFDGQHDVRLRKNDVRLMVIG